MAGVCGGKADPTQPLHAGGMGLARGRSALAAASQLRRQNPSTQRGIGIRGRLHRPNCNSTQTQVTHPCGLDVFYFPSGQREAHHPDGTKEIAFPDGGTRRVAPDGTECEITQQMLSPLARLPPPARHE